MLTLTKDRVPFTVPGNIRMEINYKQCQDEYCSCQLHAKCHIEDLFGTLVNSNSIRKPTVVAHKESLRAARTVLPFARGTSDLHTVRFPI